MTYTSLWVLSRILLFMCIVLFEQGLGCMTGHTEKPMRGLDIRRHGGEASVTMEGQAARVRWEDTDARRGEAVGSLP